MWVLGGSVLERRRRPSSTTRRSLFDRDGELVARVPEDPPVRRRPARAAADPRVGDVHAGRCSSSRTRPTSARVGLSICYDVRFPELYRGLMVMGAEVLFVPAQFQHATGKDHWEVLLRARAIENQCFVVAPGQWGTFGDPAKGRRSYGHSHGRRPVGARSLVEAPEEGDGVWFADLDMAELRRIRQALPGAAASTPGTDLLMRRDAGGRAARSTTTASGSTSTSSTATSSEEAYWAAGRTRETVERLVRESTRVVGDLRRRRARRVLPRRERRRRRSRSCCDVFVLPEYRGRGLGVELVREAVEHRAAPRPAVAPGDARRARALPAVRLRAAGRPRQMLRPGAQRT